MRILMVCPYPPVRDGIGAYAVQQAMALRAEGNHVAILSPLPSAAHDHMELRGWRGPLALARRTPLYDKVIVHFHADIFYPLPLSRREMVAVTLGLTAAFSRAHHLDLIVHEFPYNWQRRRPVRLMVRTMLRSATHVMVHTAKEKGLLCQAFGLADDAVTVIEHGSHFIRRTAVEPSEARRRLGIPEDAFVFLSIGFLQPHKGFDRAIEAFDGLGSRGCRLYVVGSVRVEEPEYVAHAAELHRLAAETPGAELRSEYVSDERFDEWLVGSDVVVLPYRYIWSSSVLERARLYERPVIASDVGGLQDQGYLGTTTVSTDEELRQAMAEAAARGGAAEVAAATRRDSFSVPADMSRAHVMDAVRRRAGLQRGPAPPGTAQVASARQVAPLLRLGDLPAPSLTSRLPSHRLAKRVLDRVMRWQTEPIRRQLNALRTATIEVTQSLAASDERHGENRDVEEGD